MKQFSPASVVFAGLLALALAGCSGTTPEPSESPSPTSAAPTSSAPPTPKPATSTSPAENLEPPEMPELATEFSAKGYEAFVDYWFEARNYALATGDVEPMLAVSDDRCGFCLKQEQGIAEVYDSDAWVAGALATPTDFLTNLSELEGNAYHATFTLEQPEGRAYSSEGEVLDEYPFAAGDYDYEIFAYYDESDGWSAVLIDLVQSDD
ncbi:DUF6318 family protein [Zhihengliuella halotolerans]|uniref:DUF6318 family protein n=1 Tax=Zhihengliuella halotolerans TaxID=370736 RepID=UPI000C800FB0|nr:DUF6318 family protein [Zhihengliuella halotolerans]